MGQVTSADNDYTHTLLLKSINREKPIGIVSQLHLFITKTRVSLNAL